MNKKLIIALIALTVVMCTLFVLHNPTVAHNLDNETFAENEVFFSKNGLYDLKLISLKSPDAKNFTVKRVSNGHTLIVDDTGNRCINIVEFDSMIQSSKDRIENFLHNELENPSWTVDGVSVSQIDFMFSDSMYASYMKDSSRNVAVYIATPSERETADMVNSLVFN